MLALRLRLLRLLWTHPERWWNLLHVLIADGTLLLLLALLQQLLQVGIHLVLVLIMGLLLLKQLLLLLLRLVRSENRIATAALELLHLLLKFQVGSKRHLGHWRRVLLLLWWLWLGIAAFQDGPALGLRHRWHLRARMGLLQIPGNVTAGHSRWLMTTAHLLWIWLRRLGWLRSTHAIRMMSGSQVVVGQLRRRSWRLAVRWLKRWMCANQGGQVPLLLLLLLGERIVESH